MSENRYYERKVRYLDLLEDGVRVGGAGFIKTEVRGEHVTLSVTVKGLHPTDTYEREVVLLENNGEITVGQISLKGGQGQFTYRAVMDFFDMHGVRIVLDSVREIQCKWQEEKKSFGEGVQKSTEQKNITQENEAADKAEIDDIVQNSMASEAVMPDSEMIKYLARKNLLLNSILPEAYNPEQRKKLRFYQAEPRKLRGTKEVRGEREAREGKESREEKEPGEADPSEGTKEARGVRGTRETEEMEEIRNAQGSKDAQDVQTAEKPGTVKEMRTAEKAKITEERGAVSFAKAGKNAVRLMEDKWQQISAIYPHIHPFRDEREYLSIGPADFVLLSDRAYRAANNSFLLHGYYNYDHLILTKIETRGEILYYIGVPGNYYEREKQVAVMFGFESFECGTEPAQAGDFGYYMMRTEL